MKHLLPLYVAVCLVLALFSCNSSGKKTEDAQVKDLRFSPRSGNGNQLTDSAKKDGFGQDNSPKRRFLRTASLKFKVHEVPESVQFVEIKTRQLGGFVSYSTITNNINDSTGFPVSTDTLLQTIHYTIQGFLTLRIPDHQLDSFLSLLNPISVFLVSREVRCEDVSLQLLSNQWNNRRAVQNNRRASADIHQYSKKPESQLSIEQWMDQQAASADQAMLNNLSLEDAVQYSTVSLVLYQDPATQYTKLIRPAVPEEFGTSFFDQLSQSVTEGWLFLKLIILNLTKAWSLLLIALIVLLIYHRFFVSAKKPKIS